MTDTLTDACPTNIVSAVKARLNFYLRRRLVSSEGIMSLGVLFVTLSHCVCVRRVSLGGEGNALYPVLSRCMSFTAVVQ